MNELLPDIEVARYGLRTFTPFFGSELMKILNSRAIMASPDTIKAAVERGGEWVLGSVAMGGVHWADGSCEAKCFAEGSLTITSAWRDPEMSESIFGARMLKNCDGPQLHQAPDLDCECGIYATLTLEHLMRQFPVDAERLVTVIAAEGRTILGDKGMRTEFARVVAYWTPRPTIREMCEKQFIDAQVFDDRGKMIEEFGLREFEPK